MIVNKVNVFDSGMEVVKAMEIVLKLNNNVKKHVLVQKELVKKNEKNYFIGIKILLIEVCLLPKMTGPCQSASIRYYYDRDKKECQQFRYGGCNGNANNYETNEKCQSACVKETIGKNFI
jgi:hypothetical protein